LRSFTATLSQSVELQNVLLSPAVTLEKKKALLDKLANRLGINRITLNFLKIVTDHRRLSYLDEMLSGFQTLLDEKLGIVRAEVAAAQPVEEEEQAALAARLSEITGKKVRLDFSVDPRLLGGAVARIDSTIYDGSVRGQLQAIQRRLASE
jgi:F-type H+-transporting ATPase subunit delta